jgi:CheY-like chemotaxis protein
MNTISDINICSFPTLTVVVDDNKRFLNSIALNLDTNRQSYKYFSNARQALEFIISNYHKSQWFLKNIQDLEEEKQNCKLVEINLGSLYQQIYNKNRFEIITNIIADYDMPEINGLQMYEEIQDLDVYKVLLTGTATEKLAVQAFNDKKINSFIPKSHSNIYDEIHKSILFASNNYFTNITNKLLVHNTQNPNNYPRNNKELQQVLFDIMNDNNIVEYYMTELESSYLLVDKTGNTNMFFVYPESELDAFYNIAKEEDLSEECLNKLAKHQTMLCYYNLQGNNLTDFHSCDKYLLNTNRININNSHYYWAYSKQTNPTLEFTSYNNVKNI